jgi:hypothetical protein
LLGAFHGTYEFHGCFAARALEGIATPNLENHVAPQWSHVTGGLFSLGREVVDDGGDEIGGFEDFEVALGGVVALGAVDDGLGGGVTGDFLE